MKPTEAKLMFSRMAFLIVGLSVLAGPLYAHPLMRLEYNRTIAVRLAPNELHVRYVIELSQASMLLDAREFIQKGEFEDQKSYEKLYTQRKAERIAKSLFIQLNHEDVVVKISSMKLDVSPEDQDLRLEYDFIATWTPKANFDNILTFSDDTLYNGGTSGKVFLTLDVKQLKSGLDIIEAEEPIDLRGQPFLNIRPEDEPRRRQCSAIFTVEANALAQATPTASDGPTPEVQVTETEQTAWEAIFERGITGLFNTKLGVGMLLLLACLFGAGHAFTPGHGKTMVAAYLVGEKGTPAHAVVLGITATLTHTGSVIALAVILYGLYGDQAPETAQGWLMLAGGLLIFLVGLWLFMQRLRGRADHVHLFSDHHHHHDGESETAGHRRTTWMRVILLGIGGGLIPCWDAVLLFLVAMAQGRIGLAIPLLLAFSLGLAMVLIGLGLAVVYANRAGKTRFGETKWFQYLPIVSAVVLLGLGVWFIRDGFQVLSANAEAKTAQQQN